MRALENLPKFGEKIFSFMHRARLRVFLEIIDTVLRRGALLTVTDIGRQLERNCTTKSSVKCSDRFFSNVHMYEEREEIYKAFSLWIIGGVRRLPILIDWSETENGFYILRASIKVDGRPVTLYEEVHGAKKDLTRKIEKEFLFRLKENLPEDAKPVLITDAGFKTPWFRDVEELGWDWIGRVRGKTTYVKNGAREACKTLYSIANTTAKSFGDVLLTHENFPCTIVLFKETKKKRVKKNKNGERSRSNQSKKHEQREREPWVLATSLQQATPQRIVKYYRDRMQIEEAFRDLKSTRYGLGLEMSKTTKKERFSILLLIGSLCTAIALIVGMAAESKNKQGQYQANSTSHRRVLSLVTLGLEVIRKPFATLSPADIKDALIFIRAIFVGSKS